jgi:MFS family permease
MTKTAGPLAPPYRALTLGMLALVMLAAFEAIAVTAAMPTVALALDGLGLYGLAFGGTMAAGIVGMTIAGGWADAKGPAAPIWTGIAAFVTGLALAGLAPDMWTLITGRIVQGLGGGMFSVALYVVVGRVYPADLHARVFAAFAGAWLIPSLAGPAVAGLLVEWLGWRWVFLSVVIATIPAALMISPQLRGQRAAEPERQDHRRTAWAFGAAAGAVLLHVAGQRPTGQAAALMVLGLAALALFTPKLLPAGTLGARPGLPSVITLRALMGAAFMQADVFIPLLLTRERGLSPATAGLTLMVGAIGWVTGSGVQGRLGERLSTTTMLRLGVVLVAGGIATAACTVAPAVPLAVVIVGWTVGGFGMGVAFPAMSALVLQLSPAGEQGVNSAAMQLGDGLAGSTVLAVGGTLFAAWVASSATAAFLAAFVIAETLALLGVLVVGRTRTEETATVPVLAA